MNYQQYTARDFVMDENFQRWVRNNESDQNQFWEVWLLQHPHKAAEVEEARQVVASLAFDAEEVTLEQRHRILTTILHRIDTEMDTELTDLVPAGTRKPAIFRLLAAYPLRAAAAVTLFLLAGLLLWMNLNRNVEYTTAYGETRTITLPDQSVVTLNAHSSLRYGRDWQNGKPREVWLQGEAFFSVRKKQDRNQPVKFTVHSGDLHVEVLGTQFTVANGQATTQVVLNEGKIKLHLPSTSGEADLIMQPGEMVVYRNDAQKLIRQRVNAEVYSSWTANKWVLENTTLQQVANRIENTYGVQVKITDPRLAHWW